MITTIQIDLTARSYGACPWDRAQIEGKIEVVPSQSRILRSIIYGAFVEGIGDTTDVKSLLRKLASNLPSYYIPHGQYVQYQKHRPDQTNTPQLYQPGKLLTEPCFRYNRGEFFLVSWDFSLAPHEVKLLESCVKHCHYLGRAEHSARWHVLLADTLPKEINCYPDINGAESSQCVKPEFIDSLYLSPGIRSSQFKSVNFPGFYSATYQLDQVGQISDSPVKSPVIPFDTIAIALNKSLPLSSALYWSDLLHKAFARNFPQKKFFERLVITPQYHDGKNRFNELLIYSPCGFSDFQLSKIASINRLYGRSTIELLTSGTYQSTATKGLVNLATMSPFFIQLFPTQKFGRNGRIRNTGYRLLRNTSFVRNGATHQALKSFLMHCGVKEVAVIYAQNQDWLLAYLNGIEIVACRSEPWDDSLNWQTTRFSGSMLRVLRPRVPMGYKVFIRSVLPIKGIVSLGYGKNFGLGVLCNLVPNKVTSTQTTTDFSSILEEIS